MIPNYIAHIINKFGIECFDKSFRMFRKFFRGDQAGNG
jgi:hypothetical protein